MSRLHFDVEGTLVDRLTMCQLCLEVCVTLAARQALYGMDGHDMLLKMLPDEAAQRRKALLKAQGSALRETI